MKGNHMDIDFLRQHFEYNPDNGDIVFKPKQRKLQVHCNGSIRVTINKKIFIMQAVKIAWALYYGSFPKSKTLTHNRNVTDVRISNLKIPNVIKYGEQIKKLLLENPHTYTNEDLMSIFGISQTTLNNVSNRLSPEFKKLIKPYRAKSLDYEDFDELDTTRMTVKQIAEKLCYSPDFMRKILNELDIPYKKAKYVDNVKPLKVETVIPKNVVTPVKVNFDKINACKFINNLSSNLFQINNLERYIQANSMNMLSEYTMKNITKELVKNNIIEKVSNTTYKRLKKLTEDEIKTLSTYEKN